MENLYGSSARGTWREVFLTGDYERHVKEGSGNGAPLCIYVLCKGNLEGGSFTGDSKRHVKKGFKKWSVSLNRGCGRETCMEASERHVMEGSMRRS